eukprot:13856392-Heterocapsa_arctica.AAC.1
MAGAQCSLCHVGCSAIRVVQVLHADLLTDLLIGPRISYFSLLTRRHSPDSTNLEESPPGPNSSRHCTQPWSR